jgi:hypothetical protein
VNEHAIYMPIDPHIWNNVFMPLSGCIFETYHKISSGASDR